MLRKIVFLSAALAILLTLLPPKISAATSQQLRDVGLVDVTSSPYNADPTCTRDSTQAIQQAMNDATIDGMVTFFPKGTYCISNTLEGRRVHGVSTTSQAFELVGSNTSTPPIIRLKANSSGFDNANSPKPVIWIHNIRGVPNPNDADDQVGQENIENGFLQSIRNLDIEIEEGNPGAVGIEFWGAQRNSLLSVRVRMKSGYAGFAGMVGVNSAISDIEVVGGKHGIVSLPGNYVEYPSMTNVRLYDQTGAAITNYGPKQWLFSGLHIRKASAPAIIISANAERSEHLTIHDAMIEFSSQTAQPAIDNQTNKSVALVNVFFKNAGTLIQSPRDNVLGGSGWKRLETYGYAGNGKNLLNGVVTTEEFSSGVTTETPPDDLLAIHSINPSNYPTPDVILDRIASGDRKYANVKDYGILPTQTSFDNIGYDQGNNSNPDVTAKLQSLIDSGAEVIFFPKGKYVVSKTIEMGERTHFIGIANQTSGLIMADSWKPTASNPATVIRTPDSATASPKISFFRVSWRTDPPNDHFRGAVHVRSGRTIFLDFDHRPGLSNSKTDLQPNIRVLMTGNAGGKFYGMSLGANEGRNQHIGYRHLLIDGTVNPLILYGPNPEDHDFFGQVGGWGMEIVNAKNVAIYGSKNENHNTLYVHDSDNIATLSISDHDNDTFENVPNAIGGFFPKGIPGHDNQEQLTEKFGGSTVSIEKRYEIGIFVRGLVNFDDLKFIEDYIPPTAGISPFPNTRPRVPGWLLKMRLFLDDRAGPLDLATRDNIVYCGPGRQPSTSPVVGDERLYTALGCIPVGTTTDFIIFALGRALSIGGGFTFLLIIYATYLYMTSTGDPKKVGAAKELLTAAFSGLILIIFSVFVLRLVGQDVLQLPGL